MSVQEQTTMTIRVVRPNPAGGWDVGGPTPGSTISHHSTRTQAYAWARAIVMAEGRGIIELYDANDVFEGREETGGEAAGDAEAA